MTPKVEQKPTPSPSGGITYSKGSNRQSEGMSDINGDGLCDYYNNNNYKINKGNGFVSDAEVFKGNGNLSEGSNQTFGINCSIGNGADLGQAKSLSSSGSINLGLSYSFSSNNTEKMMMDINGDGLQDVLEMSKNEKSKINVKYNTGNSFVDGEPIILPGWKNYVSENKEKFLTQADSNGYDLGFINDIPVVGTTVSGSLAEVSYNPFGCLADDLTNFLDWSSSTTIGFSGSVGANVNIGIDIWATFVYCGTINITASAGAGVNASTTISGASVKLTDLDGDGLVDHVLRIPGAATYWKRNISGKYGQLTQVNLPQGGNVKIKYSEKYGTVDNPNFKYVMSKVTVCDGCGITIPEINHGEHSVTTEYKYEDGYYDRKEKEFYGFKTVTTKNADETCQTDTYYMGEYYKKGALKESVQYDSDDFVLGKSETTFRESPYALPTKEENWTYEKASGKNQSINNFIEYEYDEYGNCTKLTQTFSDGKTLVGEFTYDNTNIKDYIIGLPKEICVYDGEEKLLRKRQGEYNEYGELTELKQFYSLYNYSSNYVIYDDYGNIKTVSDSRGATLSYVYDGVENMFVEEITQSGNDTETYTSLIKYDVPMQTKKSETDCNGNKLRYEYDKWQRIKEIWTAYDTGTTPAVSYEYNTPNNDSFGHHELWYAITNNKVTFDADDDSIIQTVVQIDGLGRAVRTAKTGFVNGVEGWNASGAVEYDEKGRTVKEGMTEFIQGDIQALLESVPKMTSLFTAYEYDDKDRQIKTILPDGSAQTNAFYIEENKLISETTDPLGNVSVQETDSRGNIVRVAKKDKDGNLLTKVTYEYNAMGEMLKAFDAKQNPITVEYDLLGRRTALESLDSGRQEFFYDECSNLVRENNSVLLENNKQINYEYDGLNRLVKIDYPDTED
ncbi:MAG: hypothetical protein IKK80_01210, partial [Treponema sp.]|nr:hypothetical protein [Treponema sp.]